MKRLLLFILVIAAPSCLLAQESEENGGKLRDFGKEVEHRNSDGNSTASNGSGNDNGKEDQGESEEEAQRRRERESETADLIADILFVLLREFVLSTPDTSLSVDEPEEYHTFSQYPYHEEGQGLYKIGGAKDLSIQLKGNYYRESQDLSGGSMRVRVSPLRYLSGEAYINMLIEPRPQRVDRMMLTSFFLNYHLIRQNTWTVWVGLGEKIARGAGTNEEGIAGNLTLEVYPFKPVSFHTNISWGPYSEFLGTVNVHTNRYMFYFGYQGFFAGRADLQGIVAGSSLYF